MTKALLGERPVTSTAIATVKAKINYCLCGCGGQGEDTFLQGHDLRAVFNRVNRIGTVAEFIEWFDKIEEGFKA